MKISIRMFNGESMTLEVQPEDTVQNVKKKVQNEAKIRGDLQRLLFENKSLENSQLLSSYGIADQSTLHLVLRSAENSKTVAGGYGEGNGTHEFCFPYGLAVYDEQTVVVADWGNHRIVQWKVGAKNGQVVAGGHGQGNQFNQLSCPTDVLIDKETDTLIICDRGNNRVVRWSRQDGTSEGEILLDNIACWGLAMDAHRFLYICDIERHEVRRYQIGEKNGTVVAGGRGRGSALNQLNQPTYVFVDQQQTVYVSDTWNHRVMKWKKDATEGIVAVRGSSRGLYVDSSETIYVADYRNHQLVGWAKEATEGTIIAGGYDGDKETSQLYHPWGLSYDQHGQLFVADHSNHRVQRFPLEPTD